MSSRRYRVYRDVENIECNEMLKIPNICIEGHRPSRSFVAETPMTLKYAAG
jgi:hypothetical protein